MKKNKNEYIKKLNHPSKGFFPLLCYDIAFVLLGFKWALVTSVGVALLLMFIYSNKRNYLSQFLTFVSLLIVLTTAWIYQVSDAEKCPIIASWVPQGLTAAALLTLYSWRKPIFKIFKEFLKKTPESELRNQADQLHFSVVTYLWAYVIHLTIIIFIIYFQEVSFEQESGIYFNYSVKFIVLAFATLAEIIAIFWVNHQLNNEEWIPIVADDGSIKGRMAKALAFTNKTKYRNPVVRMAFVYRDMIYLRARPEELVFFRNLLDVPFGGYLPYGVEEKEYVEMLLKELDCTECETPRRMLRYIADGKDYKRLHYLYVVRVNDEKVLKKIKQFEGGKLWTLSMIESNLEKGVFSEFFEQEFDFLLQTLFVQVNKPKIRTNDTRTIEAPL